MKTLTISYLVKMSNADHDGMRQLFEPSEKLNQFKWKNVSIQMG